MDILNSILSIALHYFGILNQQNPNQNYKNLQMQQICFLFTTKLLHICQIQQARHYHLMQKQV